ncbi:hypothetical protein QZH41_003963 [Actinostola sp. cb2023]|nr:hypothetical protein QZH41_003963 [Actinostola sp. cb2023]
MKGIDYDEVFSPVARHESLRSLLALANAHDLEMHQMDVTTAFLNGTLDCEIYMSQPEGFVDPKKPDHVCKLKKSIYGLKQSARCWNTTIDEYLKSADYRKSDADGCIYVKSIREADGHISYMIMGVYVDDIVTVSNDCSLLKAEKAGLCQRFKMVDQGEIHYLLGMSIKRDRVSRTLTINQPGYLEKVLKRFGMENCKPVSTPLELGKKFQQLSANDDAFDDQIYRQAIGCLTYASTTTRPDIAAAVGVLSQYTSNPSNDHWMGIKRVLRYIKGTMNYGLKFSAQEQNPQLIGYSDADWAGDIDTRKSTSGYVFQFGNGTVSWSSRKQSTVAKSSTEAEYVALSSATQEAIWLRRLMKDLGGRVDTSATTIYEDNQVGKSLSKSSYETTRFRTKASVPSEKIYEGLKEKAEESFYIDSDSSEDRLPNVHIAIKPTDDDRDLGTGGFKNARFKRDRRKQYQSSNSLLHEDRSASFSTTASIEFDSEENRDKKEQLL